MAGFTDDNHIGVAAGNYPYMIGGWQVPLDPVAVTDKNIGLVVNCSGMTTLDGVHSQKPDINDYARNMFTGCQPYGSNFPIMHPLYSEWIEGVTRDVVRCWENKQVPIFHCRNGENRAPCGAAVWLEHATGQESIHWLATILEHRDIAEYYRAYFFEHLHNGNFAWIPSAYDAFILLCRLCNFKSEYRLFKMHRGWADSPGLRNCRT